RTIPSRTWATRRIPRTRESSSSSSATAIVGSFGTSSPLSRNSTMARSGHASGATSPFPRNGSRRCRSRGTASTASGGSRKRSGWPRASRAPRRRPWARSFPGLPAPVTLPVSVRSLLSLGLSLKSFFKVGGVRRHEADDSPTVELLQRAQEARRLGRNDEAATYYRQILQTRRDHLTALRGLRDLASDGGRWREALDAQQRVLGAIGSS